MACHFYKQKLITDQQQYKIVKRYQMSARYLTFFITMIAYATLHMMRMSIPFIQLQLMEFFHISKFIMGMANACLYIVIGISYLYKALNPIINRQFTYFWNMNLCNLFYLITPIIICFNAPITPLFFISLAGFGFFQTAAWPVLLSLVHAYFLPKVDGGMLGLWSGNGDLGNILGFAMCTLIMHEIHLPYQYCLFFSALFSILLSIAVWKLKIDHSEVNKKQIKQEEVQEQPICNQYKKLLREPMIIFMLIMLCILKGILYGILLWLPMYFDKSGFKQYQGLIPIVMNVMAIIGSVFLGFIYEKIRSVAIRATIFMVTLLITGICFFVIREVQFTVQNRMILLVLIGIIGFCVMGNFNILMTHEITAICDRLKFKITALSSLAMCLGTVFVGIIQFIIGIFATDDSNSIFLIFLIMTIVLIVLEIIRAVILCVISRKKEGETNQLKQYGVVDDNEDIEGVEVELEKKP